MVFAHGIGGAKDLPIPAEYAMAGAVRPRRLLHRAGPGLAQPRFDAATQAAPPPRGSPRSWTAPRSRWCCGCSASRSSPTSSGPPSPGRTCWSTPVRRGLRVLWVGLVPMSLLFGPFYKAVSPMRTIHLAFTRLPAATPTTGSRAAAWVGLLAAALGLLAFVWLGWCTPARPNLFAGAAVVRRLHRDRDHRRGVFGSGGWRRRTRSRSTPRSSATSRSSVVPGTDPGAAQPARQPRRRAVAGAIGVVSVLFGSTAFDSFKDSNEWLKFTQSVSMSSDRGSTSSRCWCSARWSA